MQKIKIGISSCLLGNHVRYDGRNKLLKGLRDRLIRYVDFLAICPEVFSGMGTPREPMKLEGNPSSPRLITHTTRMDKTAVLNNWLKKEVPRLADENLDAFIFKSGSPSCGMEKVEVFDKKGSSVKSGTGLFARAVMSCYPLLPVADELSLPNTRSLEHFMEMVVVLKSWRKARDSGQPLIAWKEFHLNHRLLLLAHSPGIYREMNRLIVAHKVRSLKISMSQYELMLVRALRLKSTSAKNARCLHMIGAVLKKFATKAETEKLAGLAADYLRGLAPLYACLGLARHYAEKYHCSSLAGQTYLNPHPLLLDLRKYIWRFESPK